MGSHYQGNFPVNLNPQHGFYGWFELPASAKDYRIKLLVRVDVTIIDPYERKHSLLPFGFVHKHKEGANEATWYYEPAPEAQEVLKKRTRSTSVSRKAIRRPAGGRKRRDA